MLSIKSKEKFLSESSQNTQLVSQEILKPRSNAGYSAKGRDEARRKGNKKTGYAQLWSKLIKIFKPIQTLPPFNCFFIQAFQTIFTPYPFSVNVQTRLNK